MELIDRNLIEKKPEDLSCNWSWSQSDYQTEGNWDLCLRLPVWSGPSLPTTSHPLPLPHPKILDIMSMSRSGSDFCQLHFTFSNKYENGWFLSNQLFLLQRISWIFLVYKIKKSNSLLFALPLRTERRKIDFPIISLFFSYFIFKYKYIKHDTTFPKNLNRNRF